jgi:hypothetical protein
LQRGSLVGGDDQQVFGPGDRAEVLVFMHGALNVTGPILVISACDEGGERMRIHRSGRNPVGPRAAWEKVFMWDLSLWVG